MASKPFHTISLKTTIPFVFNFFVSIPIIILVIISLVAYSLLGKQSTRALVDQTHDRQLELATSGASTVTGFIGLVETSLVNTAAVISLSEGADPQPFVDSFDSAWKNSPLAPAAILDTTGQITYNNSPSFGDNLPSFQDRDYFIWAQSAQLGDVFIGRPIKPRFGDNPNQFFVTIATPLVTDGQFRGVFVAAISLSRLATQYLDHLKLTDSTRIYLVDSQGNMLHSPFPQLQGINYLEYLDQNRFPGSQLLKNALYQYAGTPQAGKFNAILPNAETKIPTSFMISRAPIIFDNQHWILAVATPTQDAVAFVGPVYINQLGLLVTSFLILIILIVRRTKQIVYRELSSSR